MEPKFRSSFIPKRTKITPQSSQEKRRPASILSVLTVFIFVVALGASAGVFGYEFWVKRNIDKKGVALQEVRASINLQDIDTYKKLNTRLRLAREVVAKHTATTILFDSLEESTVRSIQLTQFNLQSLADGKTLTLQMAGKASSFNALAFQSDVFSRGNVIQNAHFFNFTLDERGAVSFGFEGVVNAETLRYRSRVQGFE